MISWKDTTVMSLKSSISHSLIFLAIAKGGAGLWKTTGSARLVLFWFSICFFNSTFCLLRESRIKIITRTNRHRPQIESNFQIFLITRVQQPRLLSSGTPFFFLWILLLIPRLLHLASCLRKCKFKHNIITAILASFQNMAEVSYPEWCVFDSLFFAILQYVSSKQPIQFHTASENCA